MVLSAFFLTLVQTAAARVGNIQLSKQIFQTERLSAKQPDHRQRWNAWPKGCQSLSQAHRL